MLDLLEAENNPEQVDALGRIYLLITELRIRLEAAIDAENTCS